ncbi:MAG: hypothetical protein GTO41_11825 [Burkholderiales bacterium]|nr:hypothetical protein [Burkholderiales bacterium]
MRDNRGRFIKGQSGNPLGKAKGVRNQMTLERLAFEKALRDYIHDPARAHKLLEGIDRVLDVSINAEKDSDAIAAMKLMLDRVMPAMPAKVGEEAEKLDSRLQITIQTNPVATTPVEVVIDGESRDITEVE